MIWLLALQIEVKAADVLTSASEALAKVQGYHAELKVGDSKYEGITRPKDGTSHLKGAAEVWSRDHAYVVKTESGAIKKFEELDDEQHRQAAAGAINPHMIVAECLASTAGKVEGDEKVGGTDCWVVTAAASEELKQRQMPMQHARLGGPELSNLSERLDPAASVSSYRAWIGKKDNRVYKIVWQSEPKFNMSGLPGLRAAEGALNRLKATYALTLKDYDKGVALDVPEDVVKKFK